MRFADIVIDLAAVLNASRQVASKHVALRARQLERYGETSSIAAAIKRSGRPDNRHDPKPDTQSQSYSESPKPSPSEPTATELRHSDVTSTRAGAVKEPNDVQPQIRQDLQWKGLRYTPTETAATQSAKATSTPGAVLRELNQHQEDRGVTEPIDVAKDPRPEEHNVDEAPQRSTAARVVDTVERSDEEDEVPEGVDINIFRTGRITWRGPSQNVPTGGGNEQDALTPGVDDETFESGKRAESAHSIIRNPELLLESARVADQGALFAHQPVAPESSSRVDEGRKASAATSPIPIDDVETQGQPSTNIPETVPPSPDAAENALKPEKPLSAEAAATVGKMLGAAQGSQYELKESRVPSSRISRIWNYGGLAAGMLTGALGESISRGFGGGGQGSVMLSAANMERLVSKLSKMRGAALKLGQVMSFQDSKVLPAPIQEVLQRVQDRADYMPAWQRDKVLASNLGNDWRDLFATFEEKPIAAASIGQVHRAKLKSNGAEVAVKIQFPGVADSINSDLDNLGILLAATKLLPKGLYLNKTIDNARTELAWECDYEREAECGRRFRELLADEKDTFLVPYIYAEASGKHVLTMEYMEGTGVTRIKTFAQEQKDWIGTQILRLCLREITEFKFMQTDPNWTNFLFNAETQKLELLDFGASREYPDRFVSLYVRLLERASRGDRDGVRDLSIELGYLTGHESKPMLDAHIASVLTLAEPFLESAPELYDFNDQTITERVKAQIPLMIRERLAPPPEETYSLHRKLSGAFLLCARLGSRVRCRDLFQQSLKKSGILEKAL